MRQSLETPILETRVVRTSAGEDAEAEMSPVCATTKVATKVRMKRRRIEAVMVTLILSA
jgi:hypothetical protein